MRVLSLAIIISLSCHALRAQSQNASQIQGTVQDSSGSAVPGAEVKVTQTDTGAARTATTGNDGSYVLPNLPIGPYRLEASKQGFGTYVQTGIVLQVATSPTVDISLKVGAVSEQVQVEANAALVETEATGVGHVIESQRILELPLNGRLATDLIPLVGGTIPQGVAGTAGFPNTINIVVAGGQAYGNAFFLDGSLYTNFYDATNMPFPFPDALQEFKVETSSLTAQNGVKSGAAINAVTRGGTNDFHGDAFEFLRNGDLNARNFFAATRDTLKRHQFGGTAGGRIKRDKLFFFGGVQGTITRQTPVAAVEEVPTAAMLAGDFSACPADIPASLASQFVNDKISPSLYNPSSLMLASKLPTSTAPCGQTSYGLITQINEWQGVGRLDYQLSEKHSLFGRYLATTYFRPPSLSLSPGNLLTSTQGALNDLAQSGMIGDTYLFRPTVVNSFRASVDRIAISRFNADSVSGCDLGVQMYCGSVPHQSSYSVTGGFSIGGGTIVKGTNRTTMYLLSDDVSWVHGSHQFGFGVTAAQQRGELVTNVYAQGGFTFSSMPQFLLGTLNTFVDSMPNLLPTNKNVLGMYAQDTWKIDRRLTANIGVRWDPFFPPRITDGEVYNFNYANFLAGVKSQVYTNAPAGLTYPGDTGFPNGQAGMNKKWANFAPRVGLAWDPKGDGRMVVRASFGIAYDFIADNVYVNPADGPPFGDTVMTTGAPFNNPFVNNPGGNIFPINFNKNAPFVTYGTFIALQPNLNTESTNMWNLAVQKQVGTSWLLSATYIGSETEHMWYSYQENPAVIVPCSNGVLTSCNTLANENSRRLFSLISPPNPGSQYIGFMDTFSDGGTSSYNGLILAVQKRLSKGVSVDGNYTWSHCIGDLSIGEATGNAGAGIVDPGNRRRDRANCQSTEIGGTFSSDRRQIFNLSVVAQAPNFSERFLRAAVTGWTLTGIYRATTGGWFTVGIADTQLSGTSTQRAAQVLANPLCANPNPNCWINPAAFTLPAPGTLSNLGKDNVPGPGFFQFDLSLSRNFRIREKQNLQVRAEAFNITNSYRAGVPLPSTAAGGSGLVTTYPGGTFGTITSALDPRIMQVSMKYTF